MTQTRGVLIWKDPTTASARTDSSETGSHAQVKVLILFQKE